MKAKMGVSFLRAALGEGPEAFHCSLITAFELQALCPKNKKKKRMLKGWECCPLNMLFFKSCLGLFGLDLSFIVGLSFVRKLMPPCPLAHKSPGFFFFFLFLLYFPLNLRAQPFQITKQIKETDSSLSHAASLTPAAPSSSPSLTAFQLRPSLYFYPRCSNAALRGSQTEVFVGLTAECGKGFRSR